MSRLNIEQCCQSGEQYIVVDSGNGTPFPHAKNIITTIDECGRVEDSFIMTKSLMQKPSTHSALSSILPPSAPALEKDGVEKELKYAASLCFWCEKRLKQIRNMKANSDPKTEDPEITKYINEDNLATLRRREASLKAKIEEYMK